MARQGCRRDPAKERLWRRAIVRWGKSDLGLREFCGQEGLSQASFRHVEQTKGVVRLTRQRRWKVSHGGTISKAGALARWLHRELGRLDPSVSVPNRRK